MSSVKVRQLTYDVMTRAATRGIDLDFNTANSLRRISLTLHRWAEQECGNGNDFISWAIERDEAMGKPYRCVYPSTGNVRRYPIADREKGALTRLTKLSQQHGFYFYHQTDPRGCSLYVSKEPLTERNYTDGLAI
jgi:hypothetical protein